MFTSLLISLLSAKTFWLVLLRNVSQKRAVSVDALGNFVASRSHEEAWPWRNLVQVDSNHNGGTKFSFSEDLRKARDFVKVRFAFLLSLSAGI